MLLNYNASLLFYETLSLYCGFCTFNELPLAKPKNKKNSWISVDGLLRGFRFAEKKI